ncbi:hypothetical protein [Streptomyces sp. NPDC002088]|uniref:hypothetical protein n=1 Tax=Streptomyces sp. NPDC002088 TaxID=3154665 RepID=UPI00332F9AD4
MRRQPDGPPQDTTPAPQGADGTPDTLIGKRYVYTADALELLCAASGAGQLTYRGEPLQMKAPKALPASD